MKSSRPRSTIAVAIAFAAALAATALFSCQGPKATPTPSEPPSAPAQEAAPPPAAPQAEPEPAPAAEIPAEGSAEIAPEPPPAAEPTPAIEPEPSSITALYKGFWPAPSSTAASMRFTIEVGNRSSARSWKVEILELPGHAAVASFGGDAASLAPEFEWDGGRDAAGRAEDAARGAGQGYYRARLSLDYGEAREGAVAESEPFFLNLEPPALELLVDSEPPRAADVGLRKPLQATVEAKPALAALASWELLVLGPSGETLASFGGAWPAAAVEWDGLAPEGRQAEPGAEYGLRASVTDEFGNAAAAKTSVRVESLPAPSERSSVRAEARGLSPNGDSFMDSIELALAAGGRGDIASWKLDVSHSERGPVRSWSGGPEGPPAALSWDGGADDGRPGPEGRYTAELRLDYGRRLLPAAARSGAFVLALSPPRVSLEADPELFSPDGDGRADELYLAIDAESELARADTWSIEVLDREGKPFASFVGAFPERSLAWDGRGSSGDLVESAAEYRVVGKARDEFGNVGSAEARVGTDIIVTRYGEGYRIQIASIVFKADTADYLDVPPERAAQNLATIERLAERLSRYTEYNIRLVGHAVMVNWDDPELGAAEQDEELLPLSKARADAIAMALAERGVSPERIVAEGVGASEQVVPDSDLDNRWKNRRVEFFLFKP